MKLLRGLLSMALVLLLCSCALHPCGKAHTKAKRSDFVFTTFKGKDHEYPVAMTKRVGSPILITHGLGGLDEATLEWAKALGDHGWKVYLPLLDGEFDRCDPIGRSSHLKDSGIWETDQLKSSGQVLNDMGSLADWISKRHGNKQIVSVGNCLTGGFPLALLGRHSVKTAVLCQPAIPTKTPIEALLRLPQSHEKRVAFGIPDAAMKASIDALASDSSKRLYGFHYLKDTLAPMDKFYRLHEQLVGRGIGSKFRPVVLVPHRSPFNQSWWERMDTNVSGGWLGPHVTLTGSEEPDRSRLRTRFNELVHP